MLRRLIDNYRGYKIRLGGGTRKVRFRRTLLLDDVAEVKGQSAIRAAMGLLVKTVEA